MARREDEWGQGVQEALQERRAGEFGRRLNDN